MGKKRTGKVITRGRQAVVVETEKMDFREVDVFEPKGKEVVVKITISGVCHSDVHAFEHSSVYAMFPFPQAPGHEIMGKVYAKGPDASSVELGESVLVYPWIKCDKCERCLAGNMNWCASPISNIIGGAGNGQGGYAEYVTVLDKYCVNADGVDPELAVILPCCGLTSYNAVKQSQLSEQSTSDGVLAIIGTGGLGMMGIQWAKHLTKQTVVAIDIRDEALETALEYGADYAINCVKTPNVKAQINKLPIKNKTVEAIIDFVNNTKTHNLGQSIFATGTNFVIVGIHGGEVKLNLAMFPLRSGRYSGVFVGSLNELKEEIEICRSGKIRSIVTKRRPLDEIQDALKDLQQGKIRGRSIVTVSKL